jgi:hypothetical protein
MDEETRALRAAITRTRGELGQAAGELSERLAPRRQAERLMGERRDAARERIGDISADDIRSVPLRVRDAIAARPQAAAALGAVALLMLRRRARRR